MTHWKEYLGEAIGTFLLVLFGCGAVAGAVLFGAFGSLLEVAIIWGVGVTLAIFSVRNVCPAHLNPAVSVAMCLADNLSVKKLPIYIVAQFLGALFAGVVLFVLFQDALVIYEEANGIVRGSVASMNSAMMFGEFYPNPHFATQLPVSTSLACGMEALGTFILVFVIFRLTENEEQTDNVTPILIGLTVTIIICLVAPFTQAGLNPARDFGPRLVAYLAGWGEAAFSSGSFSFITVYMISPVMGALIAFALHRAMTKIDK